MRPTLAVSGDMPGPKVYIGWWGAMGSPKQKGITQYTLSPYRQKPLKGMLSGYVIHGVRRLGAQVPYFGPPFAIGYLVYTWAKAKDHYNNSKAGHIAAMAEGGHAEH
ncbi:ubiquinol--cytochrome-c reductase subunit 8 [Serendipita sp. 405]|nr:ubiquinol--cytochrome-c reductase subunit 8 [Serendipita sp. 405]